MTRFLSATALTAAGMMMLTGNALADNWTDHQGEGISIDTSTPNTTNITQTLNRVTVTGDGDINAGWTVNVAQPSSKAQYILYDTEADPTEIMGNLNANGEIFIFDQNGVIFGENSRVDVGALVASTGHISADDFADEDGKYTFQDVADGTIALKGSITVADAGLAAFVAPNIINSGVINAKMGKVAMGAGEKVTLDLYGDDLIEIAVNDKLSDALIENTGAINAEGGTIVVKAEAAKDIVDNVINMAGVVNASSATMKGGKIVLGGGSEGVVKVAGKMDASGTDGGDIKITGKNIEIASSADLSADAGAQGNAGRATVVADDTATINGRLSAKGIDGSGFIETSGNDMSFGEDASVTTTGDWLIDPTNITINNLLATILEGQLLFGNATVSTPAAGAQAGNINVTGSIDWFTNNSLTLNAHNDINLNAGGQINSNGNGDFIANAGRNFNINAGSGGIDMDGGDVVINNGGTFFSAMNDSIETLTGTITLNQNVGGSIQNAVNALDNHGNGQNTINIGAGTYDETVQVNESNVWLKGAGQGSTIIKPTSIASASALQHPAYFGAQNYKSIILAKDANNVDVSGLTIDASSLTGGAGSTNPGYVGLFYYNAGGDAGDLKIIGGGQLTFGLLGTADSTLGQTARTVNVTNVDSGGSWWAALAAIGNQLTMNVLGGTFNGTGGAAAMDLSNGTQGSVTNATLTAGDQYGENAGIVFHGGHDWTVTNTDITGHGTNSVGILDHGVAHGVAAANNINIQGGTISNVGTGIEAVGGGSNWDVNGTTITSAAAGVGKGIHYSHLTGGADNTISNVNISGFDKGIHNDGTNGTQITGGTLASNTTGILINPSVGVSVEGATITGGVDGIVLDDSDSSFIYNNTISGHSNNGILMTNTGDSNNILSNTINGGVRGIYLSGAGDYNTVSGNTIGQTAGTSYNGIEVVNSGSYSQIDGNHIYNAGWDGININNSGWTHVGGNDIHNALGASGIAFVFHNGDGWIENNTIENSARLGIYVGDTDNLTVSGNTITNSGTGNYSAVGPFTAGIYLEQANGTTVDNNIVNGAKGSGIQVGGPGNWAAAATTGNVITNNKVANTGADGISVRDSAGAKINNNQVGYLADGITSAGVDNIKGDGIYVDNSNNAVIKGNKITETAFATPDVNGSDGSGIQVTNSTGVVIGGSLPGEGNVIKNADWDGIRLQNDNNVTVEGNDIDNTGRVGIWGGNVNVASIKNNIVKNDHLAGYGSIHADGGSSWNVFGNDVDFGDYGIFLNGVGGAANIVDNNDVDNVTQDGIRVTNTSGLVVVNNDIGLNGGNVGGNGIFVDPSNGAYLSQNEIKHVGLNGIYSLNNSDVTIQNNTIDGTGLNGILVQGGNNVTVGGPSSGYANIVNNTGADGIAVNSSTNAKILNNKIGLLGALNSIGSNAGGGDGIFLTNSDGSIIQGNKTANTHYNGPLRKGSGILVTNSDNVTIGGTGAGEGNDISLAGSDGIVIRTDGGTADNNKVVKNTIHGAAGSRTGIYTEYATNTLIDQNTVNGTGRYAAIYANGGSDTTISKNILKHNDEEGIRLENSGGVNKITGNKIDNTGENLKAFDGTNSGDAIHVVNASGLTVSGNQIGQNGGGINGDGIFVDPSNVAQLFDNAISNAAGNGIWSQNNDDASIYHNTIDKVTGNGILVEGGNNVTVGGATAAKGNTITNAGLNGIKVDQTGHATFKTTVQNNTVSVVGTSTASDGILVLSGTGSLIDSNKIIGTDGGSGILHTGSANGKAGATRDGIHVEGNKNVVVSNNTVTGGNGSNAGSGSGGIGAVNDGIYVKNSENANINHNTIKSGTTIPFIGGPAGKAAGANGIEVVSSKGAQILSNAAYQVGHDGILASSSDNLLIQDNTIGNGLVGGAGWNGIEVSGGKKAVIKHNTVQGGLLNAAGAGNDGIHVDGNQSVTITNNTIKSGAGLNSNGAVNDGINVNNSGAQETLFSNHTANGATITGNTVTLAGLSAGAGHDGIHVVNSAGGLFGGAAALIGDNTINVVGNDGIFVNKTTGVNVVHNGVTTSGDDGIEVDNSNLAQLLNNTVSLSHDVGILVDPSSFTLTDGNTVTGSGSHGIQIIGGLSNTVSNNTVTLSGDDGIRVDNNNLSKVLHNTVTLSDNDGVEINGGIGGNVVDGNTITLSGAHGVNFHDSALGKITNNTITLSDEDGVNADNAQAIEVAGNTVSLSGHDGVHVTDSLAANIHNNLVDLSDNDGISLNGSALARIADNLVVLSGGDGIDARNLLGADIEGNVVVLSGGNGIYVDPSLDVTINDNLVLLSALDGIHADDVIGLNILNNIVGLTGDDGIDVQNSAGVVIANNATFLTGGDGIQAGNVLGLGIFGNLVTLAGDDGIDVDNAALVGIADNTVLGVAHNGIEVSDAAGILVAGNNVALAGGNGIDLDRTLGSLIVGNNVALVGHDGIRLDDSALSLIAGNNILFAGNDGIEVDDSAGVGVIGNDIAFVLGDGIDLDGTIGTLVAGNDIAFALGNGIRLDDSLLSLIAGNDIAFVGSDGIEVDDSAGVGILGNNIAFALGDGIDVDHTLGTLIAGNDIAFTGGNGIRLDDSALSLIAGNDIAFTLRDGIHVTDSALVGILDNDIAFAGGDGVDVDDSDLVAILGNDVDYVLGNGIEYSNGDNVLIAGNNVGLNGFVGGNGIDVRDANTVNILTNTIGTHVQNDGIFVDPSSAVLIQGNNIDGVGASGIHVDGNPDVTIANNIVSNSGANGLFVSGGTNGSVVISGNTFNNNPIGMLIQSGAIDLTGDTNFINGGQTGILFDRFGGNAPLTLVSTPSDIPGSNGTFGTTTFTGQSDAYIALANNAFSNGPNDPILLDVSYGTFDGFSPNSKPRNSDGLPILTAAEYNHLEDMFYHFHDLNTIGLLLFGFVPGVDQEDILRYFDPTNLQISGLNVTVRGLPQIPGGPASFNNITPFAGGGASALNNITPAAGGDGTAQALNAIDTAAGGEAASCWGDAAGIAQGGQIANLSYATSAEDTLSGAATCGSSI